MEDIRKKAIIIVNTLDSVIAFRLSLMMELQKYGYHVSVFSPGNDSNVVSKLEQNGISFCSVKMDRTGVNPFKDFIMLFALYRRFRNEKPDIIFNYTLKPIIYSSIAGSLAGIPKIVSVLTGFGSVFIGSGARTKLLRLLVKPLLWVSLRLNNTIFALNPDIKQYFSGLSKIIAQKIILINGEGLDTDYYKQQSLPLVQFPIFLIITRLIRDKGIYEYLKAAQQIKIKFPEVKFKVVGSFDSNPSSIDKKEFMRYVDNGCVEYLGWLDDVRSVIMESSVYVLPSYAEGMPRSTLEAMSMGRPIITTNVPGCRETVVDGVNGFLIEMRDVESLVEAMEKFILNPKLIESMGGVSRAMAVDRYDVKKVNDVIVKSLSFF